MAKRPGQKITMTSIDELLCVPDTEGTIDIDVEAIYPFENHPFKVIDDERMEELTESIRTSGVLTPVLVRPDDEGTYEMISGHMDCQHFFRQIFLGYFPDIVQAFGTLGRNVYGDNYTSLHNPIVLSSVLLVYGMFHSTQILF